MKSEDVVDHVLLLAVEDASGLWEVLWDLATRYPDETEERRRARAGPAVRELIEKRLVKLYRCKEPDGEMSEVSQAEADAVLAEPLSWEEPEADAVSIRIQATPEGERAMGRG